MPDAKLLCAAFIIWNIIVMLIYGLDKLKARSGAWRIPERVLMLLALFMGAAGAFAGMRLFRHKLRKGLFAAGVPLCLLLNAALIFFLFFKKSP